MSLHETSEPEGILVDLPLAALYPILHRAGRCTREVCTAFLHHYGPLPSLAPWGVETTGELLSALATTDDRHRHLTHLDLSCVHQLVTDDSLYLICKALPNLRSLRLGLPSYLSYNCGLTAAGIAAATSQLPHLDELHMPDMFDASRAKPLPDGLSQGWSHLRELTLPAAFIAPSPAILSCCTALQKLSVLGDTDMFHLASVAAQLPALLALEEVGNRYLTSVASVQSLTQLTALGLSGSVREEWATAGQLLRHIGTLTNLRSLELKLWWSRGKYPSEPGWLAQLSFLTSLRVDFGAPSTRGIDIDGSCAFDEVVSSVPLLLALRKLRIANTGEKTVALSAAACALIQPARSRLEHLHLKGLWLPATAFTDVLPQLTGLTCLHLEGLWLPATAFTDALPQLTGLTCLHLERVTHPIITSFTWLTRPTALRRLRYDGVMEDSSHAGVLPSELLAGLSNVDALFLPRCVAVDGPYLEQLCASMPQLRHLDLSYNPSIGAGLSSLQHLTNLEVVGLAMMESSVSATLSMLQHVRAPLSLRRCYLGWQILPYDRSRFSGMLGRRVDIVFSEWEH